MFALMYLQELTIGGGNYIATKQFETEQALVEFMRVNKIEDGYIVRGGLTYIRFDRDEEESD